MILKTMDLPVIFNKRVLQVLTVLSLTVILLLTIFSGLKKGKLEAQTEAVLNNTQAINKALEYFFQDQDRYPTAMEFAEPKLMGQYLSLYPIPDIVSENCSNSFRYLRIEPKKYDLFFCLSKDTENSIQGWNKYSSTK